ncbi:MAG: exo-alpha-sialidase [Gemmatimonadetes bacterium]|jgi:sialidase-1|nr:exo-alpha-sialidase [Gemmatimonadota bacterium]
MPPRKRKPAPLWLHPSVEKLPFDQPGPFVRLKRGGLLTVDDRQILVSRDRGKSWKPRPLFAYGRTEKEYKISQERRLLRTRSGVLILAFMNLNERVFLWRDELHDALPGTRLPCCVVRSLDDGKTWQNLTVLHEEWTGELRDMIQTRDGRVVLSTQKMLNNPGRHGVLTYGSDDDGATWTASNLIDLGGCGHHGGTCEAAIAELDDGRLWLLLRTNWSRFWQAYSTDGGSSWRDIGPSDIDASSAPGLLRRLRSGRLLLCWNRLYPEGKKSFPLSGGDGLWSEVPVSNHREELSIALSEDDGQTFNDPVVIARQRGGVLSYPRIFEIRPGELWLTTMQGGLRLKLNEADFI